MRLLIMGFLSRIFTICHSVFFFFFFRLIPLSRARGYKTFFILNSTEHENFSANIYMKMLTIVGIFIFIRREIFMLSYFFKKETTIVSNLRFICRTKFTLSWVEHEKCFVTSIPEPLFTSMNMSKFKNGRVHLRNSVVEGLMKLRMKHMGSENN